MRILFTFLFLAFFSTASAKQNISVTFSHTSLTVNGRLQLPDGSGPFQVVVINPGTGANDKDGTLTLTGGNALCLFPGIHGNTLTPYLGLSEALSDSGYAVLTYDKIEYTYPNPSPISFERLWLPVESAIRYLKTRSDIDTSNIILLGHSEGSSIIPFIARKFPEVKALISLAGPRRPLDTLLAYQLENIATICNGDVQAAINDGNQILQYVSDIRNGLWNISTPPLFGVSAAVWSDYFKVVDSVAINYNIANRKTLFIGLGDDINVPVNIELPRFQQEVSINATYYNLPGLNHYLTTASTPSTSEALTDTIVYWLRTNIFPLSVAELPAGEEGITVVVNEDNVSINTVDELITGVVLTDVAGRVLNALEPRRRSIELPLPEQAGVFILSVQTNKRSYVKKFTRVGY